MDQPTYTPVQKTVEAAGTLFFKFGDLDSTKPAGSIRIRIETIVHYLAKYSGNIIQKKLALLPPDCPLLQAKQENDEKALTSVAGSD
jgi:predicted nucleotide-binding protein (sugar kinase/HSP70/actin superfamily)